MNLIKLLLVFFIGFSFLVKAETIHLKNIKSAKIVPFFDPSYLVISVPKSSNLSSLNLKNSQFIKYIQIVKTPSDIKLVFELKNSDLKKVLKKTAYGYVLKIDKPKKPKRLTAKKNNTEPLQKVAKSLKKKVDNKKTPQKLLKASYISRPIKPDSIKPKKVKLTQDPLFSLVVANLFKDSRGFGGKKVIVIDPGHGGKDPGAIANGLKEKNVALKLAKLLKGYLESDGRFKVYLTRSRDRYISLYNRTVFALKKKADLFISIHCNADPKGKNHGTYIYTLSTRGARLKLTRLVAERENRVVLREVHFTRNWYVNRIIAELAINTTMTEGLNFAYVLKNKLKYITDFKGIDSANFAVLKTPGIPSVLIETAYITNKHDARLLKNPVFLQNFAASIYMAIVDYFYSYKNYVYRKK